MHRIGLFLSISWVLASAPVFAADCPAQSATPPCAAFLDNRIVYSSRQRAPVELAGYVETHDASRLDREATFSWEVDGRGARIVPDANRKGRALFFPGYLQNTYHVTLSATSGGQSCSCATVTVHVDVDYTQYVQARTGTLVAAGAQTSTSALTGGRLVDEFTQLTVPMYLSADARRTGTPAAATSGQSDVELRFGMKLFDPRIYAGFGYRTRTSASGAVIHGMGYGVEKVPDIDLRRSFGAFAWYYPSFGTARGYNLIEYGAAVSELLPGDRFFLEAGVRRDHGAAYGAGLRDFDDVAPFVALGLRL